MIILKSIITSGILDNYQLDEMSRTVINSKKDGLPFRVVIQSSEHPPPHAHILDFKTGEIELGQFVIPKALPKNSGQIAGFKQGITEEMRDYLFKWFKQKNWREKQKTNLQVLLDQFEWNKSRQW